MGACAQALGCDASTATWLIDRLEERGLVERRALPADRRVKAVALTPLGAKTKAEVTERLYEPPDELVTLDRAVLEGLQDALTRIRSSIQPAPGITTEPAVETA